MPELRKDILTGRWVIITTERSKRPTDFAQETAENDKSACPFCPGNESKTPPEVFAVRPPGGKANSADWQVRVVPNRFPALRVEGDLDKEAVGIYDKMNGVGAHEVIIESPHHDVPLEELPHEAVVRVLDAYRHRTADLLRDNRLRYIQIFKNVGRRAGATLSHPHSQLIATPITPLRVKEKLIGAREYYDAKDRSVFHDILRQEQREGTRLVYENSDFISFCPFAARFPFELCILPKRQNPEFHLISSEELQTLADMLKVTLQKLSRALNRPQYNYLIHTMPSRHPHRGYWDTIDHDFRWHIEILPRLTWVAGFEWGSGFFINPTAPEESAKYLRETSV